MPAHQQRRALLYGILGAFVLRFLAILSAAWIIKFWFLQVAGGLYLLWLAFSHLTGEEDKGGDAEGRGKVRSFWGTVAVIELTDLAFAVDSVLAALGVVEDPSRQLWIIYAGAVIGLVAMRFAAIGVLKLLERFPQLGLYAYVLVGWIGLKLTLQGTHLKLQQFPATADWVESVHLSVRSSGSSCS